MSYITKCPINMSRRSARDLVANPYRMHAMISAAFPSGSIPDGERILWRVDTLADKSKVLYIVSPIIPSMIGIDEQIGYCDLEPQYKTVSYDTFLDNIHVGQVYDMRLCANTTYTVKCADGRVRRLGHKTITHRLGWLLDSSRLFDLGIEPVDSGGEPLVTVTGICDTEMFKYVDKTKHRITLSGTRFDGVFRVVDAEKFKCALLHGVGHARAFGFGMLTAVPCGKVG